MIGFEGSPINGVKILTKRSLIIPDNKRYLEFLGRGGRQTAGSRPATLIIDYPGGDFPVG